MALPLILYDNAITRATIGGGSWVWPAERVRTRPLTVRAASDGLSTDNTSMTFRWSRPEPLRGLIIASQSGSRTGTVRVRAWSDLAMTLPVWDSTEPLKTASSTTLDMAWFDYGWFSGIPAGDYTDLRLYFPQHLGVQALDLDFTDPDNAGGRIEIGYVFAGRGFEPAWGAAHGSKLTVETTDEIEETEGGIELGAAGRAFRIADIDLPDIEADEAWGRLFKLLRTSGRLGEVWLDIDPAQATNAELRFLARLSEPDGLTWQSDAAFSTRQQFKEVF